MPIQLRNKTYYYRKRVPKTIAQLLPEPHRGKAEITFSLGTTDKSVALGRASQSDIVVVKMFEEARIKAGVKVTKDESFQAMLAVRFGASQPTHTQPTPEYVAPELPKAKETTGTDTLENIFKKYKQSKGKPVDTLRRWDKTFDWFLEVAKLSRKTHIRSVTTAHVRTFKDHIIEHGSNGEKLSPNTVNGYLTPIKAMLSYAFEEKYIDNNPGAGINQKGYVKNSYKPYNMDDVKNIFKSRTWQVDKASWGPRQWIPYIALYTGARLEEIAGLLVTDVKREGDIHYLNITTLDDDDKPVKFIKNEASKRPVPIGKALIELGFLDYVKTITDTWLFPTLTSGKDGKRGKQISSWYSNEKKHFNVVGKKVFHSYRHTMKDALRETGCDKELNDALLGHSTPGQGADYGLGFSLKKRKEAIDNVVFPV
jgi:integrase